MGRRRIFSPLFKEKVVKEVESGVSTWAKVQRKYELDTSTICRWRDELSPNPERREKTYKTRQLETEMTNLERRIGRLVIENELLKKVLALAKYHSGKDVLSLGSTKEDSPQESSAA